MIENDGRLCSVVVSKYQPPVNISGSHLNNVEVVSSIPGNARVHGQLGLYYVPGPSSSMSEYQYFFQYDPYSDIIYVGGEPFASWASFRARILTDFISSSVYQELRWPYITKGAVDPDLEGVQEKMTGGLLPMLLLLLGCGIGLKLLDYGSIKLMRFWDDKDSQRALTRINNIDDPLEHKVALEAHRKAYNARFKRYAKEDRQRRRR